MTDFPDCRQLRFRIAENLGGNMAKEVPYFSAVRGIEQYAVIPQWIILTNKVSDYRQSR